MTDDPFGDLGSEDGGRDGRSAAERLEERDRTHPEPQPKRPEVPRPSSRYSWVIGIAFFIVVVIASINAIPNNGKGSHGIEAGKPLPEFAAPLATGNLTGDANIRQAHAGNKNAGKVPACQVKGRDVVNLCLLRRKPLVLTFIFDKGADCNPQVDLVERVRRRFPQVQFATVFFTHKNHDEVRMIVQRRGWREPVALDQDGQLTNLYNVGVCPTTVFAYRGGRVMKTLLGMTSEQDVSDAAQRLLRGPPARSH